MRHDTTTDTLSTYLREMGSEHLLTPKEEHEAVWAIASTRQAYWEAILGYPWLAAGITKLVRAALGEVLTRDLKLRRALSRFERAAGLAREQRGKATKDGYNRAAQEVASLLAYADCDGRASESIAAEVHAFAAGQVDRLFGQPTPRRSSPAFARYVMQLRQCGAAHYRAKDRFARANLRLVVTMARRFDRGKMPFADLVQEGNLGLLKAVDRFDPRKGFRFSTYATWWIRHAINRAVADKASEVRVPVHVQEDAYRLAKARRAFEANFGRAPSDEEVCEHSGVTLDKLVRMREGLTARGPSLDAPTAEGVTFGEAMPADVDLDGSLQALEVGMLVEGALAALKPFEAEVLRKRFGFGGGGSMTLREIGVEFGLSRERIRQIQEEAMAKIRGELTLPSAGELLS